MKKLMILAVVLLSSVGVFAQHGVGTITVQPKVGMNIATLTDVDNVDSRIGLAAGAEFEYQATDMISITAGALYSMQGCKDDNSTWKFDYINIPILANVYVANGLAVKLGVQPGFNVNSSVKSHGLEIDTDNVESFDFSIPVGVSYEYNNLVLDARYNWGLTKIIENTSYKNSVFQITLGYKFAL